MTRPKNRKNVARRGTGETIQTRQVLKQEEMFPNAVEYSETSMFSGPLPPPELLYQYNEIVPGAADRIIACRERSSAPARD
jgi:uncharacterized membrane protein